MERSPILALHHVNLFKIRLQKAPDSECGNFSCSPLSLPLGVPWGRSYFSLTFLEYFMIHPWSVNFLTLFPWKNFFLAAGLRGNAQNLHKQRKRDTLWCFISCFPHKHDSLESHHLLACSGDHQDWKGPERTSFSRGGTWPRT